MNDLEQIQWETLLKVAPMLDDNELSALCYGCGFQYREVRECTNSGLENTKERNNEWH